ncbi:hypothetical protein HS041_28775 [Planomonospora sp. ID67723]|uniref:hypothetical protein n=1 Tax=Planomonospora sp. ID67723 TaxID=2738134 RepID=UPI0018C36E1E|nr:hypothetical protein [Planomonospora sp. ID67723]MBG0831723.1 hypothetical protein [Planomonospora sp. ID67723]
MLFAADGSTIGDVADLIRSVFSRLDQRSVVAAARDGLQRLVVQMDLSEGDAPRLARG